MHAFRDVEIVTYCPRKLYYHRQSPEEVETPVTVEAKRDLAFRYPELLTDDVELEAAPIDVTPTQYRSNLGCARARLDCWEDIADPAARDVYVRGRDCHGIVHKVPRTDAPTLSLVFGGRPPRQGIWQPQSVRLVAAAKAISWERETDVERAFAEYPAYGVVREIEIDARRTATYRAAVRTASAIDGPPARTNQRSKCTPCEFQPRCGVRTRSLRSLLGG